MPRAKKFLQRSMVLASRPRCWRAVRVRRCNSTAKTRNLSRSEEHTSELQSRLHLVCRLLLEKKKNKANIRHTDEMRNYAHIISNHGNDWSPEPRLPTKHPDLRSHDLSVMWYPIAQ